MKRRKLLLSSALILSSAALIMTAFQNCAGQAATDNGNGYGGNKVEPPPPGPGPGNPNSVPEIHYVELQTQLCADGSQIHAAIDLANGTYLLVRESCTDLPSPVMVDVTPGPNSSILYSGRKFNLP